MSIDNTNQSIFVVIGMPETEANFKNEEIHLSYLIRIKTLVFFFFHVALFYFLGCRYFRYISKQDHQVFRKKIKRMKKLVKKYSIVNPGL